MTIFTNTNWNVKNPKFEYDKDSKKGRKKHFLEKYGIQIVIFLVIGFFACLLFWNNLFEFLGV